MMNKGVFYALGAGICWGASLGLFARAMTAFGFSAMQISAVRTTISAITFILIALTGQRSAFRLRLKDIWIFLCSGFISLTLFCWCYFTATANCSLAVASILQYTAPIWVVLLSALVFREKITGFKACTMELALLGCILVSGIFQGAGSVSAKGLLAGIFSGVTYGLYTIFTRFAVPRYSTITINLYTFAVASASSLLLSGPAKTIAAVCTPAVLPTAILGGILCAAVPYYLYTKALEFLDNGKASLLATIEPVIATAVSALYLKEALPASSVTGIALILASVILLALPKASRSPSS